MNICRFSVIFNCSSGISSNMLWAIILNSLGIILNWKILISPLLLIHIHPIKYLSEIITILLFIEMLDLKWIACPVLFLTFFFPFVFSGNLDKQTALGNTVLHYCSIYNKPECLKLLLRGKPTIDVGKCII